MGCFAKAFEFYEGEDKTLSLQVNSYDRNQDCKEPLDLTGASEISLELPGSPDNIILNTTTTPAVTVDQAVLGKIHVDLTSVQTGVMMSGSIVVRVTKSSKVTVAVAEAACRKLEIPNC